MSQTQVKAKTVKKGHCSASPQENSEAIDDVRKLIAEEGRSARNLIAWNVPLNLSGSSGEVKAAKPPLSPRLQMVKSPVSEHQEAKRPADLQTKSRVRSASAGRDPKIDLRARYWAFLFENLRRAIDEIYQTCEADESIVECKEAILILDNYTKEFNALIDWLNLKRDYETTPKLNRPTSLAWEVRKSSPVKILPLTSAERHMKSQVARALTFNTECKSTTSNEQATSTVGIQTEPSVISTSDQEIQTSSHLLKSNLTSGGNAASASVSTIAQRASSGARSPSASSSPKPIVKTSAISLLRHQSVVPSINNTAKSTSLRSIGGRGTMSEAVTRSRGGWSNSNTGGVRQTISSAARAGMAANLMTKSNTNSFVTHQNKPIMSTYHARQAAALANHQIRQNAVNLSGITSKPNGDPQSGSTSSLSSTSSGKSWADKVKGPQISSPPSEIPTKITGDEEDSEGWETVQRSKFKSRISPPQNLSSYTSNLYNRANKTNDKNARAGSVPLAYNSKDFEGGNNRRTNVSRQTDKNKSSLARSLPSLYIKEFVNTKTKESLPKDRRQVISNNKCRKAASIPNINLKKDSFTGRQETVQEESNLDVNEKSTLKKALSDKIEVNDNEKENIHSNINKKDAPLITDTILTTQLMKLKSESEVKQEKNDKKKKENTKKNLNKVESECLSSPVEVNNSTSLESEETSKCKASENETESEVTTTEVGDPEKSQDNQVELEKSQLSVESTCESKEKDIVVVNDSPERNENECTNEEKVTEDESSYMPNSEENVSDMDLKSLDDKKIDVKSDDDDVLATPLDDALESAIKEEENLTKQIEETQNTDPQMLEAENSDQADATEDYGENGDENLHLLHNETEELLGNHLAEMSWGDRMDRIDAELRLPGHALHMHEKLSSPSRKRSLSESIRRHKIKQAKAQEQRERLLEEKAQKLRELSKKAEEVRMWKEELLHQRRDMMEKKLLRAEEKRRIQLQMIVRKAHDEEEKVNEIAFINTLEAQNKRHDVLSRIQGHEARLQDLQEERQRKQEEKAAKEAAVEERRRVLEAERMARLMEIQEKRKQKEHKIEQQQQEKEKERLEQAREKARDREERLSALHAAQQANVEELQKKIQQKQEESARRHEENIEHIRQKAFELSVLRYSSSSDDAPRLVPYETKKLCTVCNVLIASEVYLLSHLRGKKHQQAVKEQHEGKEPSREELESYNLNHIIDAPADKIDPQIALDKERQKALKKRCKKLRQRMASRGTEYENSVSSKTLPVESSHKTKLYKFVKDVNKCFHQQGSGPWPNNIVAQLDRTLGEMTRILEKKIEVDQTSFRAVNGFQLLDQILGLISRSNLDSSPIIPNKSLVCACNIYHLACRECYENCHYILYSNKIGGLLDLLIHRLNLLIPDNCSHLFSSSPGSIVTTLPVDGVAGSLMQLVASVLVGVAAKGETEDSFEQRIQDVVSYIVSVGIVDKLAQYFNNVRGPIDSEPQVSEFLLHAMGLLTAITNILPNRCGDVFERRKGEDPTQFIATLRVTGLVGTVSLLYGMLLHSGAPSRGETPPPQFAQCTLSVTIAALKMLSHMALLELPMFQGVLGDEGLSLEFRHIASYLLWYCTHWDSDELLSEVILNVGYFTVLNSDNQMMIQSGHMPTVLQQLCSLPFPYFSNPQLTAILLPTLIACSFLNTQNKAILEQEMSCVLLTTFIQQKIEDNEQSSQQESSTKIKPFLSTGDNQWRWQLRYRFPLDRWKEAEAFFAGQTPATVAEQ